jgi:dipeptidyl-peptidase-4
MHRVIPALLLFAAGAFPQKKQVTIESFTSAPPAPSGFGAVTWAPDGKRFLYTEEKFVWLYAVEGGVRKKLISLDELKDTAVKRPPPARFEWQNRRVVEPAVQWSESGNELLIRAGGDLFLYRLETAASEQLTATADDERDPKLAPGGEWVSFRRGHDLYALELASKKVVRLTHDGSETLLNGELDWVYPEELDLGTAHWWSPDGRRIAYLQFDVSREPVYPQVDFSQPFARLEPQRFPQPGTPNADVRLGLVAREGGSTRWMDLGETRGHLLARVHWSPDSRSFAVHRLNRIQNRLELKLADADTGVSRVVLREQDPYWVNLNDHFRFLDGGRRFLFGSERDGYLHLYLYSADGKRVKQLTRGEWEVSEVACVDEPRGQVYYVSSEPSPLERHFYRVSLGGGGKKRLTRSAGTHSISMGAGCEFYLDTASSLTSPPRRTLHRQDGAEVAVYREADPPEYELLPREIVQVKASDGARLYGRLIRPSGFKPGRKYPVVVLVYGGPHAQAVRNAWSGAGWPQVLAQRGFVVWQLDNRGSSGRGHQWESRVFRNLGAQELKDQQEGIRYLESLGFVDPSRIGIYGWSYGGFMTLYAMANAPGLFRAGIAGAPVTDWRNYDTIYTERYMGLPEDNPEGYRRSSPITRAADITGRLLLVHNLQDDNVHFQNTMQMAEALERHGKKFSMLLYPQKTHGVTGSAFTRHMYEAMTEFFEESLKRP